jgi:hypothetical protein
MKFLVIASVIVGVVVFIICKKRAFSKSLLAGLISTGVVLLVGLGLKTGMHLLTILAKIGIVAIAVLIVLGIIFTIVEKIKKHYSK